MISEQNRVNEPNKKRFKGLDIYAGLDLRYVSVASTVLRNLLARCGRETVELCQLDAFSQRRWAWKGENITHNRMVISSGSMISPFPFDSTARSARFYQPWSFTDAKDLKSLVLLEVEKC